MALHHYKYKKALLGNNLEIEGKSGTPEFMITISGILTRSYEIKHIPSGTIMWKCKEQGIFSSGKYSLEKPGQNTSYKITSKGIISTKFALEFAGVEVNWKYKSLFSTNLIAVTADDSVKIVEITKKLMSFRAGVFSVDLSAFDIEKAGYDMFAGSLATGGQAQAVEYSEANLAALMMLATYVLHLHMQAIRKRNEKLSSGGH